MNEAHNDETPEALYNLGKRFYLPSSGEADPLLAIYYFNKSAEKGYAPAQRILGTSYLEGRLLAKDYQKARFWLNEAAGQKDPLAICALAFMYINGLGGEKNWLYAYELLLSVRSFSDAAKLKIELKNELFKSYPVLTAKLENYDFAKRHELHSGAMSALKPWGAPERQELDKEEFCVWLDLKLGKINEAAAFKLLTSLIDHYYKH